MPSSISTRSISNVTVSFGVFAQFPAKIYAAAREEGSGLNLVARNTEGKWVKPTQQYAINGTVIPWADLERGYDKGDEAFVVIPKGEIEGCKVPESKQVEITKFIPLEQVDPLYFDKAYVLVPNVDKKDKSPNPKPVQAYATLLAVLKLIGKVGQAKMVLRGKEHNIIIRAGGVDGNTLMLHTLYNTNEIRNVPVPRLTFDITSNDQLMSMGATLVNSLAGDFDPKGLTSKSEEQLDELINRKVAESNGEAAPASNGAAASAPADDTDDLMAALKASLGAKAQKETVTVQ